MSEVTQNRCPRCGAPKNSETKGSLTQWIATCRCDLQVDSPAPSAVPIEFCAKCKKRIELGRAGSFTQWILRVDTCNCEFPEAVRQAVEALPDVVAFEAVPEDEEEDELEVEVDSFPLDRYKPIAELGAGVNGRVYLCRDRLLDKRVAMKLLRAINNEQRVAFQKEARAGASLAHANLVSVLDFGITDNATPYLVMDYVDGVGLDHLIKDKGGWLPVDYTVYLMIQIADALYSAHQKGIYHRDIKPSNVLIVNPESSRPTVRVIDFGVAAVKQNALASQSTQELSIAGTPLYMAPDQALGLIYDQRSEIYSLGCMMFELLTGNVPYSGDTVLATMNMHARAPIPSLSESNSEQTYPEWLQTIINRCLAKDPKDRFASMGDLATALYQRSGDATQTGFIPAPKQTSKPLLILVVCAIGVIVGFVTIFSITLFPPELETPKAVVTNNKVSEPTLYTIDPPKVEIEPEQLLANTPLADWEANNPPELTGASGVYELTNGTDRELEDLVAKKRIKFLTINHGKFSANGLLLLNKVHIDNLVIKDQKLPEGLHCHQLQSTTIARCKLNAKDRLGFLYKAPISFFSIYDTDFDDKDLRIFERCNTIQSVEVISCKGMKGLGFAYLKDLRTLNWTPKPKEEYSDEGMKVAMSLPYLYNLYVNADHLTDAQFALVANNPRITTITLTGEKPVKDEWLIALKKGNHIRSLGFKGRLLADSSWKALTGMDVDTLYFLKTEIDDAELIRLPEAISFKTLVLDEEELTKPALKVMLSRAKNLNALEIFRVTSEISVDALSEIKRAYPKLTLTAKINGNELEEIK